MIVRHDNYSKFNVPKFRLDSVGPIQISLVHVERKAFETQFH
jgi:hypothetical protein